MAKLKRISALVVDIADDGVVWSLAEELFEALREDDREELTLLDNNRVGYIVKSIEASNCECTAYYGEDSKLLAVMGITNEVSPLLQAQCIWMLGTGELAKYKREFIVYGQEFLRPLKAKYARLCNFINIDNKLALTFITHVGAKLYEPIPYGRGGCSFVPFVLERGKHYVRSRGSFDRS